MYVLNKEGTKKLLLLLRGLLRNRVCTSFSVTDQRSSLQGIVNNNRGYLRLLLVTQEHKPFSPWLEDLLKDIPPEKLDQPCRDDHLSEIALSITRWKSIAPFLGLTKAEEENIEKDCGENETQKIGMLRKWRERFGRKATYRKLTKVFFKLERVDLVEEVCELLQTEQSSSSSEEDAPPAAKRSILDSYAEYLRGRYSTELPAFFTLQWPPPPTHKVFNLAMIGCQTIQRGPIDEELVRLTLRGGVDDIMRRKSSIELENLFKLDNRRRKIILIEGAPGAGKSTLAWHIIQKWESRELFLEFRVVVFVQLRDPHVQAAKYLADLLPVESEIMRSEVMSELQTCRGRNVLFVLDGWDEYGPGLQLHSFFQQLICSPALVNMHFSSLIITSRPIASGELQRYASSRVEIVGFSSAEVKKYFSESIGDTETEQKLQDHLRERPVIEASCYLPLNAAIVVHLFLALNHTLPHTLHEVFVSLVLCCIIRHLTRLAERGKELPDVSSLDDLPPDVFEQFNNICTMAYHGVMKNEVTFSASDLQSFDLPTELSTLSLIQAVRSFMGLRKSVTYNFLHLSVQELLAAFRISKLSATEQIQIFNNLFGQPRLAVVFRFYAAFTKLQTEGVRDIVARIVQKQEKPLLVNLLHGLYEAQDPSLCEFVASHLNGGLDLSGNTLSPMDCLVVGYFLSCICLTTTGEFKVNLTRCSLDDYRASFLIKELSKCSSSTDARTTTGDEVPGRLAMDLRRNQLSGHGISSLLRVMNVITMVNLAGDNHLPGKYLTSLTKVNCFPHLKLTGNQLGYGEIVLISNGLKTNTILKRISVARCSISEKGCKAISDALMVNRSLQVLDLHGNPISAGVVHIAESLKHNHSLLEINLSNCDISEKECEAIGEALMVNRSLQVLDLYDNPISAGVEHIAESLKHNHSLLEINLSRCDISEKGAKSLAISLKENNSLLTLILSGNSLSDGAAAHIADGLRHNDHLKKLDILGCSIGDQGMKSLGCALKMNSSLEDLNVTWNHSVTGVGLLALGESLKKNRGLKRLKLWRLPNISDNDWKQFIVCLQENNHLTKLHLLSSTQVVVRQEMTTLNDIRIEHNLPPLSVIW